jgi:hypothetical protein
MLQRNYLNGMHLAVCQLRLPLWSSAQSSWPQIQRSCVRFLALRHFLRSSGSERGRLSLVSTIEELLGRKTSVSSIENSQYGHMDATLTTWYLLSTNVGSNFAEKWRSLGRYSSLTDSGHGFYLVFYAKFCGIILWPSTEQPPKKATNVTV